jgi:hypothetical protein
MPILRLLIEKSKGVENECSLRRQMIMKMKMMIGSGRKIRGKQVGDVSCTASVLDTQMRVARSMAQREFEKACW